LQIPVLRFQSASSRVNQVGISTARCAIVVEDEEDSTVSTTCLEWGGAGIDVRLLCRKKGEENQAYDNGKGIKKKGRDCGCTR
jgi:hypothetical protein